MDFSFAKIEGTAGWYYDKWPGFLSVDAYRIMEAYSNGENIEEYVLRNKFVTVKKRKIENDVLPESFERNDETTPGV
jgi:hypothetical protein